MARRARTATAKDQRRAVLLDAAMDEFFERGFAAARMEDIAARAGLSKGTLYLYFDSKDALFTSIIDVFAVGNVEKLEQALRASPTVAQALTTLAAIAPQLIRHSNVPRLLKVLVGDSTNFPDTVRTYRERVLDRILGAVTEVLHRGHERGEIVAPSPHLTARLVIAPMVLSALWHVLFAEQAGAEVDLEALFAQHVAMLQRALGAGAAVSGLAANEADDEASRHREAPGENPK